MSLGAGAYKDGENGQCSSTRKEVSMATLRAAPTRHRQTELFSGILTDQYLPSPEGGRVGKNTAQKWQASNQVITKALAYTSQEVPLQRASHPPPPRG